MRLGSARFSVNRLAKALNGWQHERAAERPGALAARKRLFPQHVAVISLRLGWQTGCTTTGG
jgi:hypothetical protein